MEKIKIRNEDKSIYVKRHTNDKSIIVTFLLVSILGIIGSYSTSTMMITSTGFIATIYTCYKIIQLDLRSSIILLFGSQFLRAVIRIYIGSANYSFLLLAIPVFIFKYLLERSWKIRPIGLIPIVLLIFDLLVASANSALAVGDQLLWGLSYFVLLAVNYGDIDIDINLITIIFGLAIWDICIVNMLAEISMFGYTLVPSMYGTWTSLGEYYSFGKGYVSIAGGNEIAQYIPIFVAIAILNFKNETMSRKLFYIVSSIFFLYVGLMCIARAFYVEIFIFLVLYAIAKSRNPLKLLVVFSVFAVIAIMLYSQFYSTISIVVDAVIVRFDAGSEGRVSLIKGAFDILKTNPFIFLFGAGSQYTIKYENATAHNIIVDAIVSLGVVGSLIYLVTIVSCFASSFKRRRGHYFEIQIPLIMFIVYKMISGSIRDVPFYFMIILITLILREGEFSGLKSRNKNAIWTRKKR